MTCLVNKSGPVVALAICLAAFWRVAPDGALGQDKGGPAAKRQESAATGPKPGTWGIQYESSDGFKWVGTFVLVTKGKLTYAGEIDWKSADGEHASREQFEAIYDPRGGTLTLVGADVQVKKGVANPGTGTAKLSPDGARLAQGEWRSAAAKGAWQADWTKD